MKKYSILLSCAISLTWLAACGTSEPTRTSGTCTTVAAGDQQIRKFVTTDPSQVQPVTITGREFQDIPDQSAGEYFLDLNIEGQIVPVIIDTGSSNLVVNPGSFNPDPAKFAGQDFYVRYGSLNGLAGKYNTNVNLNCGEANINYTLGVFRTPQTVSGILGLAYPALAQPNDRGATPIPPLYDQLVGQSSGQIIDVFGMALCGHKNGDVIVFGGGYQKVAQADLTYVPVIKEKWYVVDARSMQVLGWNKVGANWVQSGTAITSIGDFPTLDSQGNGLPTIIDSGTTMNIFPSKIYDAAIAVLKAASNTQSLGIPDAFWTATPGSPNYSITIPASAIARLPTFQILIRGLGNDLVELNLKPDTYLKELEPGKRTSTFRRSEGTNILGQPFMEGYYVEFDRITTPNRIGFASNSSICTTP